MCTATEWNWYKENLTEGCTFLYHSEKARAVIHLGGAPWYHKDKYHAKFDNPSYSQAWHIGGMDRWYLLMHTFAWPDGSPMVPFVAYDGKPYNPVLAKIASLDARFKAKALPKTTQEPLPLPA